MRNERGPLWRLKEAYLRWRWQRLLTLAEHYKLEADAAKAAYDAYTKPNTTL